MIPYLDSPRTVIARRLIKLWDKETPILPQEHTNAKRARNSKYLQNAMKAVTLVEDAWPTTEFSAIIRPMTANLQVVTVSSENSQCWRIASAVFRSGVFSPTRYTLAHLTVSTVSLQVCAVSHNFFRLSFSDFSWRKCELLTKQRQDAFWCRPCISKCVLRDFTFGIVIGIY
jgi:hypothetical protein